MTRKPLNQVKVAIRDYDLLKKIDPASIHEYLDSAGWAPRAATSNDGLSYYVKPYKGTDATVIFPAFQSAPYYPQYIRALIDKVAAIDGLGALEVLEILAYDLLAHGDQP